jgi:hypothetical protein
MNWNVVRTNLLRCFSCGVVGFTVVSMWCPYGVYVVSMWCPYGVYVVSMWCLFGVYLVYVYVVYMSFPCGVPALSLVLIRDMLRRLLTPIKPHKNTPICKSFAIKTRLQLLRGTFHHH